jgi:hypothetical protein
LRGTPWFGTGPGFPPTVRQYGEPTTYRNFDEIVAACAERKRRFVADAERFNVIEHAGVAQIDQDGAVTALDDVAVTGAFEAMNRGIAVVEQRRRLGKCRRSCDEHADDRQPNRRCRYTTSDPTFHSVWED